MKVFMTFNDFDDAKNDPEASAKSIVSMISAEFGLKIIDSFFETVLTNMGISPNRIGAMSRREMIDALGMVMAAFSRIVESDDNFVFDESPAQYIAYLMPYLRHEASRFFQFPSWLKFCDLMKSQSYMCIIVVPPAYVVSGMASDDEQALFHKAEAIYHANGIPTNTILGRNAHSKKRDIRNILGKI